MLWPLSSSFSFFPSYVFLQNPMTARQSAPQRSLSAQKKAAVRMLFTGPLQQVLERKKVLACNDIWPPGLHDDPQYHILCGCSSITWTPRWLLTHLNVTQVAVYTWDRSQQQGEQLHFLPLHLATLSNQRKIFISISVVSSLLGVNNAVVPEIPARRGFSRDDSVCWTPVRGRTPG